jgi:hypothetical protein
MSWLRIVGGIGALGVLLTSLGCGSSQTTPTAPTYTNYTDVFSDGVLLQGAAVGNPDFGPAGAPHKFTIHQASSQYPGSISVTIGFLSPVATVGVGLTTWNATNQSCDLPLPFTNFTSTVGSVISASVGSTGDFCVALFDIGSITSPTTNYTITVGHT